MIYPRQPRLVTCGMVALREAADSGVGVAQVPAMIVREALDPGGLLHVAPAERQRLRDLSISARLAAVGAFIYPSSGQQF